MKVLTNGFLSRFLTNLDLRIYRLIYFEMTKASFSLDIFSFYQFVSSRVKSRAFADLGITSGYVGI